MIKFFVKSIIFVLLFLYALLVFLPKENLYYLALENLKTYNIVIKNEIIEAKSLELSIIDANVFFKSIDAIAIDLVRIKTLLFYSSIDATNVKIDKALKQFLPPKIDKIKIQHFITNPLNISISFNAKDIKGYGTFNLLERKLNINFSVSNKFVREYGALLRQAKKQSNGEYKLEYQL